MLNGLDDYLGEDTISSSANASDDCESEEDLDQRRIWIPMLADAQHDIWMY